MPVAPWELGGDHSAGRAAGVDRPGVGVDEGVRAREALRWAGQSVLVPQEIHQVGGVALIEHRELRQQTQRVGVLGDQPVRHRVEGAAPQPSGRAAVAAQGSGAGQHVRGGSAGERQQQHPGRVGAVGQQLRHPRGQRPGLAGSGTGHDHQRPAGVRGGGQLRIVESYIPLRLEHECEPRPSRKQTPDRHAEEPARAMNTDVRGVGQMVSRVLMARR